MQSHRLFISIELPDHVKKEIVQLQELLHKQHLFEGNYPSPATIHCTLAFLGNIEHGNIVSIIERLKTIRLDPFEICLYSLGVNSSDYIRVIWVNLVSEKLSVLEQNIKASLSDLVTFEQREFVGHITLARIRKIHDRTALLEYITADAINRHCFMVDRFHLKESIATPSGYVYTEIQEFLL
jgi:2'-5' RNA ligase